MAKDNNGVKMAKWLAKIIININNEIMA